MKIQTALILCAGFGKRLNPITLNTPKPLLKLNNITMLENCINLIKTLGIKKIILNTFYQEEKIIEFLRKKKISPEIQIIKDGDQILNTGGGILKMINSSSENDFIIFNPDTLWDKRYVDDIFKMQDVYFSKKLNNILLLTNKELSFDKSLIGDFSFKNNLIKKDNRDFIFIGCQILNKSLFKNYKIQNFSVSEIWNRLLENDKLNGFESLNKFYHLTDLKIFKKLQDL
jgi:MurNAc alpha-1-phosphate uridylyltransferase